MIAVIDYGIGNLRSAEKALQHMGADAVLVDDPTQLRGVQGIVLPGVGAFGACALALRERGFETPLREAIARQTPFLGLCVGFQLLFAGSEESPGIPGLGIVSGMVRRLHPGVKLPQMQWNTVRVGDGAASQMLGEFAAAPWFYFVHSYAPMVGDIDDGDVSLLCEYGQSFVAGIERDNLWGTQFHPEKSGAAGLGLLGRFLERCLTTRSSQQ